MQSVSRIRNYWTAEEDRILRKEAMSQVNTVGNVKNWNTIAAKLESRTNKDCRKRWSKLQTNIKKGVWSSDEDDRLRKAVKQHGFSWTVVARSVQTRHADQCAKRWYHFLDPNLIREEWKEDEDERLVEAVRIHGRAWREISEKEFPRRSATDLKNRYCIVQRNRLNGKSPASLSPSHSMRAESQSSGPSPTFNSDMTYESDSDLENGGLVQDLSPGQYLAFGDTSNFLDSSSISYFLENEDIDVDMFVTPDIIDSYQGPLGHLKPQFSTSNARTSCTLASGGIPENLDQIRTELPDMVPSSSLYTSSDVPWPDPRLQMDVYEPMSLPLSDSPEFIVSTQPNINFKGQEYRYNLLLENVHPEILSHMMDIVLKSQHPVKMKLSSAGP